MRINYNVSAMLANNALANNDNALSASLERLSTGFKVNHAKDNPAGLAMAKRMNAQIIGLGVANDNAGDGISVIEIADGALNEVSSMLQRISELTIKASNGTTIDEDRAIIQDEIEQLKEEIERVKDTTQFNGQNLLDGTFDVKGYTNYDSNSINNVIKATGISTKTPTGTYTVDSITFEDELDEDGDPTGNKLVTDIQLGGDFPAGVKTVPDAQNDFVAENGFVTIKGSNGFEMKLDLNDATDGTVTGLKVEISDVGPMRLQIGANEGQVLEVEIPPVSLRNMGIENIDVSTEKGAKDAMSRMDGAIGFVSRVRGKLGAYQNRLESTVNSLDISEESMTAAYSRLMDTDMAEEMTQYTTNQVLTQAGTSMLAQANERPSQVLQLLQ
ncbi:MAG: flagellin FliC3 [Lachnospiraceae bacterium]|nr:flagellin FliC3 [Lachnospiraceae bacterium]